MRQINAQNLAYELNAETPRKLIEKMDEFAPSESPLVS